MVTGGQRHDGAMLQEVLGDIRVPRIGCGQARTRPDALLADRGYTSRVNRAYLRERGIAAVIPEKSNGIAAGSVRGQLAGDRWFDGSCTKTATWSSGPLG